MAHGSDVQHGSLHLNATVHEFPLWQQRTRALQVLQPEPERSPAASVASAPGTGGNLCKVCAFETDTAHKIQLAQEMYLHL